MRSVPVQGETVRLSLISAGLPSGSGGTTVALNIYNQYGLRTLQKYECLIIDTLYVGSYAVANADSAGSSPMVENFILSKKPGGSLYTSAAVEGQILASLVVTSANGESIQDFTDKEGLACDQGVVPSFVGQSGNMYAVNITGTGRIINMGTQGVRPNWRESLNGTSPA